MVSQNKSYHSEEALIDTQANGRIAMDRVTKILMMAGSGCKDSFPPAKATTFNGQNTDFTNILTISNRTDGPDKLTVIAAIRLAGTIASDSASGTKKINPTGVETTFFDTGFKKYLTVVPSHKQLLYAITTKEATEYTLNDPIEAYTGDRIYRVNAYTIALDYDTDMDNDGSNTDDLDKNGNNAPDLYIYNNASRNYVHTSNDLMAEGIEDIQFRYAWYDSSNNIVWEDAPDTTAHTIIAIQVFILARTLHPDKDFRDIHDDDTATTGKQYVIADHTITLDTDDTNGISTDHDHHFHRNLLVNTIVLRNMNL